MLSDQPFPQDNNNLRLDVWRAVLVSVLPAALKTQPTLLGFMRRAALLPGGYVTLHETAYGGLKKHRLKTLHSMR